MDKNQNFGEMRSQWIARNKQKWLCGHALVSMGDWFPDPLWIPKSLDTQIPYIKWHRKYIQSALCILALPTIG